MGDIISIVSGKGGVGKTTLCSFIACALAAKGKNVIAIDTDLGLKNLDILLGLESKAIFDISDVVSGRCSISKATVSHDQFANLHFISAPQQVREKLDGAEFCKVCETLAANYDYVLIDAPAGLGDGFQCAVQAADKLIVVATPDLTSIRDAQKTVQEIHSIRSHVALQLLINRVRKNFIKKGYMQNVDDIMDHIGLGLLGLMPDDENVIICAHRGAASILKMKTPAAKAISNIAGRLDGDNIKLAKLWRK